MHWTYLLFSVFNRRLYADVTIEIEFIVTTGFQQISFVPLKSQNLTVFFILKNVWTTVPEKSDFIMNSEKSLDWLIWTLLTFLFFQKLKA